LINGGEKQFMSKNWCRAGDQKIQQLIYKKKINVQVFDYMFGKKVTWPLKVFCALFLFHLIEHYFKSCVLRRAWLKNPIGDER
jgi:hypothetical protein